VSCGFFGGCGRKPVSDWDWAKELERPDGTRLEFSGAQDKPVLLVFYSSWSSPSVPLLSELPGLGDRARVIAVLADPDNPHAANDWPKLEVVLDRDMEVAKRFGISVLPTAALLDRRGRQVDRFEGYSPRVCSLIGVRMDSLAGI
jgi:thioredoxin-like negative regulator of GroEL